jgi:hypothetical protein
MRRTGFIFFVLALEVLLVLDMRAQKAFSLDERDVLVHKLSEEVSQFIEKKKLSGEDQRIASEIIGSLFRDPPLKTMEERIASNRLVETRAGVSVDEEQNRMLKERIESLLKRHRRKNIPIPIVTPDQMHDLDRLFKLNDVLRKRHLPSSSIGKLIELVFERIETAISA